MNYDIIYETNTQTQSTQTHRSTALVPLAVFHDGPVGFLHPVRLSLPIVSSPFCLLWQQQEVGRCVCGRAWVWVCVCVLACRYLKHTVHWSKIYLAQDDIIPKPLGTAHLIYLACTQCNSTGLQECLFQITVSLIFQFQVKMNEWNSSQETAVWKTPHRPLWTTLCRRGCINTQTHAKTTLG